eukprot:TRINITY_DN4059_c0_g1_i4.p2 TRINITY_DN4059_c0_g1~~TRINITY_DN4059_c0_g1_i4.p2  ORF type:complete len:228 (+),score=-10.19 TRINITY_DN4059_c0_g1_i4:292-975(+)
MEIIIVLAQHIQRASQLKAQMLEILCNQLRRSTKLQQFSGTFELVVRETICTKTKHNLFIVFILLHTTQVSEKSLLVSETKKIRNIQSCEKIFLKNINVLCLLICYTRILYYCHVIFVESGRVINNKECTKNSTYYITRSLIQSLLRCYLLNFFHFFRVLCILCIIFLFPCLFFFFFAVDQLFEHVRQLFCRILVCITSDVAQHRICCDIISCFMLVMCVFQIRYII